jgi:beta-lactamase superfamily II metal-dependent hydrolase
MGDLAASFFAKAAAKVVYFVKAAWGSETFPPDETSAENEMSVVQYANLCGEKILLTADTGRAGLTEAANFAHLVGLYLPGIDRFQVPHHGSRRNVSSELLDYWLGPKLATPLPAGMHKFTAAISSAKEDKDHPRKAVVRAMIHRGATVVSTEGCSICLQNNQPPRGWGPATAMGYPDEEEE